LFDENKLLFEQNKEKSVRNTVRGTVVGRAKVILYSDIVEAQRKRDVKENGQLSRDKAVSAFTVPVAQMVLALQMRKLYNSSGTT
jgi:hypothetical protein